MWIRSQNKYILANVNSFRICKSDLDGCVYYSIHGQYDRYEQSLGYYSTEEKALKVLEEIQDAIEDTYYYNIENIGCGSYALKKGCEIYEMPQD